LVPKKATNFKKTVAEELKLPENLVNDFIDFFWDRVRTHMSNLNHESIFIPNLGTFKVKHWKIDETIENHKLTMIRVEGRFSAHKMRMDLGDKIDKLEKIKKIVEERELKFKKIKDARKAKDNMEEQDSNMGGSDQQDL